MAGPALQLHKSSWPCSPGARMIRLQSAMVVSRPLESASRQAASTCKRLHDLLPVQQRLLAHARCRACTELPLACPMPACMCYIDTLGSGQRCKIIVYSSLKFSPSECSAQLNWSFPVMRCRRAKDFVKPLGVQSVVG